MCVYTCAYVCGLRDGGGAVAGRWRDGGGTVCVPTLCEMFEGRWWGSLRSIFVSRCFRDGGGVFCVPSFLRRLRDGGGAMAGRWRDGLSLLRSRPRLRQGAVRAASRQA